MECLFFHHKSIIGVFRLWCYILKLLYHSQNIYFDMESCRSIRELKVLRIYALRMLRTLKKHWISNTSFAGPAFQVLYICMANYSHWLKFLSINWVRRSAWLGGRIRERRSLLWEWSHRLVIPYNWTGGTIHSKFHS